MGRPLRRHEPGQHYLVTTRCHQAQFLLRPDPALNAAMLEWLTRAQQEYPAIPIFAAVAMSNHLHLVVRDLLGELAGWSSYFFGNLSRAVNRIRGRSGACFARRYSAEPILDDEALIDRMVYVVTNPVKAGLCQRASDWPGVVLYAPSGEPLSIPVSWPDRGGLVAGNDRRIATRGNKNQVSSRLVIDPLPASAETANDHNTLEAAIEARENELRADRRAQKRKVLGPRKVLAQGWRSTPKTPSQSPRPVCHSSKPDLRRRFIDGFREFVGLYREASARFRRGDTDVAFPNWSYPPGRPMVRPTSDRVLGTG